jgi:hypothetical protein
MSFIKYNLYFIKIKNSLETRKFLSKTEISLKHLKKLSKVIIII